MRVFKVLPVTLLILFGLQATSGVALPVHELVPELEGNYVNISDDEQDDTRFGFSVAMHGDTLAMVAPETHIGFGTVIKIRGFEFAFRRQGGQWQPSQRLNPGAGNSQDRCGSSAAVSEFYLIVGCPFNKSRPNLGGRQAHVRAVLFCRNWELNTAEHLNAVPLPAPAELGSSVAAEGGCLAIGAPGYVNPDVGPRGRVLIYACDDAMFSDRFEFDQRSLTHRSPQLGRGHCGKMRT